MAQKQKQSNRSTKQNKKWETDLYISGNLTYNNNGILNSGKKNKPWHQDGLFKK